MTWRERRLITVLSIILAILSAAVLIVLGIRYREARARAEAAAVDPAAMVAVAAEETGSQYVALEYFNGSTTLAFDLTEEGQWVWRYDHDFPLDTATVTAMLDTITTLTPQQTLTEHEELENYGLDSPDAALTVTTREQTYIRLDFGKATTDGTSNYCLLNGDNDTVYIFDGKLLELMQTPIYDMCILPELPELTEKNLLSVTLFGSPGEADTVTQVTELTAQKMEGATAWLCEGKKVTASASVKALLEDITSLSIDRCVDYNPSDEAVTMCGFDAPTARVTIEYTDENGEEGRLLLTIANPLPDESGRYVRIGEDTTIYYLPTALLDPMMRIAVNGLES